MSSLSGHFDPTPVNDSQRIHSDTGGNVDVCLWAGYNKPIDWHLLHANISLQQGSTRQVLLDALSLKDCLHWETKKPDCVELWFRLRADQHPLAAGNYLLQIRSGGREFVRRSLNVGG